MIVYHLVPGFGIHLKESFFDEQPTKPLNTGKIEKIAQPKIVEHRNCSCKKYQSFCSAYY